MNYESFLIQINTFEVYLRSKERSVNTCKKYTRDLHALAAYLDGAPLSKTAVLEWKESLIQSHAPASVNSMLAAVNGFLSWAELTEYQVRPLKLHRSLVKNQANELSQREYEQLVCAAESEKNIRLVLMLRTIHATGIRVSELQLITVEAVRKGYITVKYQKKSLKKFIPKDLCRALRNYCKEKKIDSGLIFRTSSGKPFDRTNVWRDMKMLCESADVTPSKVSPRNLSNLFCQDVSV